MLPDGRRLGAHLPLAPGHGQGGRARPRHRGERHPDLQPTTRPPGAAAPSRRRARGLPERGRASTTSGRSRSMPRTSSTCPGPTRRPSSGRWRCSPPSWRGAPTFGARFVNVHIGSHRGTGVEVGIVGSPTGSRRSRLRSSARSDLGRRATLVLENSAGEWRRPRDRRRASSPRSPTSSGRAVSAAATSGSASTLAHAWGAGIDVGTPAAVDAFLAGFDAAHRARPPRPRPSQRHPLGARLADRSARAPGGGPDRRRGPRPRPAPSAADRTRPTSSRRRAWTPGTTRSTWSARGRCGRASRSDPLPQEAFELAGSARGRMAPA